jgi:DNA helicase II / ATP-dependent DNA helicase PcrA
MDKELDLQQKLQILRDSLRPGQRELADWQGGRLAVSAVPGAGKSTGMATAAAIAIAKNRLHRQRQLVIVTFTRSAALNIRNKVVKHLQFLGLPQSTFIANTLHGLAFSIASHHPDISGISLNETQILTEAQKQRYMRQTIRQWQSDRPKDYQLLVEGKEFDGEDAERMRRQTVLRTEVLPNLAKEAIVGIKSSGFDLNQIQLMIENQSRNPLVEYALKLYQSYIELLQKENKIDYDDMILAGLRVLENQSAREYWQQRIFAVFEDEAQDSSPLQTKLLETLAWNPLTSESNLVRVGDPNQAINSTFTSADPRFFNQFCDRCQRLDRLVTMDRAGRSASPIIAAANFALEWTNKSVYAKVNKPFRDQIIKAVEPGDPQLNPQSLGKGLEIRYPHDIEHTAALISERIVELSASNDQLFSMAVLVRNHKQGLFLFEQLQHLPEQHQIELYDVEQSDRRSHVPMEILAILQFLQRPHSPDLLKQALIILQVRQMIGSVDLNSLASIPEQFLFPSAIDPELSQEAKVAQAKCVGLLQAKIELPLYYLLSFIALTLGYDQGELATADKLSDRLSQQLIGKYTLPDLLIGLKEIVESENFEAVETENLEGRYMKPGQLTIISLHKAKGLDWDVVFLPFLHERTCPGTSFLAEGVKFLADFSLPDVLRLQLRNLFGEVELEQKSGQLLEQVSSDSNDPDQVWQQCQNLKQSEELRLLYVGMTRAKRLLWLSACDRLPYSWNNLNNRIDRPPVCPVLRELAIKFPESVIQDSVIRDSVIQSN